MLDFWGVPHFISHLQLQDGPITSYRCLLFDPYKWVSVGLNKNPSLNTETLLFPSWLPLRRERWLSFDLCLGNGDFLGQNCSVLGTKQNTDSGLS